MKKVSGLLDTRLDIDPNLSVPVIGREEFVKQFGKDYSSGQHVTMLGPTQRGKTTLAMQLLSVCTSKERKAVILAGKPDGRDHTMEEAPDMLNMRRITEWPPVRTYKDRNRVGYVLRPLGKADSDVDEDAKLSKEFKSALKSLYSSRSPVIAVIDEASLIYEDLKLKKEYEAPLKRGAPVVAVWSLVQRGRNITYHVYNAAEHIFCFYDPDESNRIRYSEFGGVDPKIMRALTAKLKIEEVKSGMSVSQCLYIRRAGPKMSIVDIH